MILLQFYWNHDLAKHDHHLVITDNLSSCALQGKLILVDRPPKDSQPWRGVWWSSLHLLACSKSTDSQAPISDCFVGQWDLNNHEFGMWVHILTDTDNMIIISLRQTCFWQVSLPPKNSSTDSNVPHDVDCHKKPPTIEDGPSPSSPSSSLSQRYLYIQYTS